MDFSKGEIKNIKKYCGDSYVKRYQGIQKRLSDNVVKLVNTGMVSSGKSSLFNVLVNSEEEFFATGAARTTVSANSFIYKNIEFIDTPGIDVKTEDDKLAFDTIMEADIIMMLHNIRTGPLNRSEVDWLKMIADNIGDPEKIKKRILFVCTWRDTRENDEDYSSIIEEVKKSVFDILGTEVAFFDVSVKKYLIGVEKQKDILIKKSNLLELSQYLESYAQEYLNLKNRIALEDLESLAEDMKKSLSKGRLSFEKEIEQNRKRIVKNYKLRYDVWKTVFDYFSTQRKQLKKLGDELDEVGRW
ncbi:GTPase [Filifactor villosus]|uniref:GTPase n=1 Tax=Filifactor villosus TaxID=29374 RepID=A0ABV9QHY0_9FIRM